MGVRFRLVFGAIVFLFIIQMGTHACNSDAILTSDLKNHGISKEDDSQIGPIYPNNVAAEPLSMQQVHISWRGTSADYITHYNIYRAKSDSRYQKVGQVPVIGNNKGSYQFEDTVRTPGLYRYAVTAIDINGLESQKSLEVIITVGEDTDQQPLQTRYKRNIKEEEVK